MLIIDNFSQFFVFPPFSVTNPFLTNRTQLVGPRWCPPPLGSSQRGGRCTGRPRGAGGTGTGRSWSTTATSGDGGSLRYGGVLGSNLKAWVFFFFRTVLYDFIWCLLMFCRNWGIKVKFRFMHHDDDDDDLCNYRVWKMWAKWKCPSENQKGVGTEWFVVLCSGCFFLERKGGPTSLD